MAPGELQVVNRELTKELKEQRKEGKITSFDLFRGDSAQVIVLKPSEALLAAFRIKTRLNRMVPNGKKNRRGRRVVRDLRIAVGVGSVSADSLNEMTNDEPFVLSGRELDEITETGLSIGVRTPDEEVNKELSTVLFLYEGVMRHWTLPAAEVIYHKLLGKTEREIAGELGISQSAVNQHSQAAYWNGLSRLLERYREITDGYDDPS